MSSCEATRVRGSQSAAMLDRRTLCFERQRAEVEALVEVFAGADAGVVAHAGEALAGLPDLGACGVAALDADADADAESVVDEARREDIEAGFASLARARVELRVGRPERASELARAAQTLGETLDHVPLALDARALLAMVSSWNSSPFALP